MSKVAIPDPIGSIPEKYRAQIAQLGAEIHDTKPKDIEDVIARTKDAEIITANYINVDRQLINFAPNLKYVIVPAVGYNNVDVNYATERGIKVLNCPSFVTIPVAEHALALMLSVAKRFAETKAEMQNGIWDANKFTGVELHGKKLGLLGHGRIGKMIESMATALGMTASFINSKSSDDEVDALISSSDIICICLPLTDKTEGMFNSRRIGLLQKSAILVNVGRGAVIDQSALLVALSNNAFMGAGLDVFVGEPDDKGKLQGEILELAKQSNVMVSPHSAFNTSESLDRLGQEILDNINSCLSGNPQNVVN